MWQPNPRDEHGASFWSKRQGTRSSPGSNIVHLSQPLPKHMDIDIEACKESTIEGQHSEHTQGKTHVPIVAVETNLEVLGCTTAPPCTDSNSLSFRWAMEGLLIQRGRMAITMMWKKCGTTVQEKMANTLKQVASVFEGTTNDDCVPSPIMDTMVSKAIDYVTIDTSPRSPIPPELHFQYECGIPPHEG